VTKEGKKNEKKVGKWDGKREGRKDGRESKRVILNNESDSRTIPTLTITLVC